MRPVPPPPDNQEEGGEVRATEGVARTPSSDHPPRKAPEKRFVSSCDKPTGRERHAGRAHSGPGTPSSRLIQNMLPLLGSPGPGTRAHSASLSGQCPVAARAAMAAPGVQQTVTSLPRSRDDWRPRTLSAAPSRGSSAFRGAATTSVTTPAPPPAFPPVRIHPPSRLQTSNATGACSLRPSWAPLPHACSDRQRGARKPPVWRLARRLALRPRGTAAGHLLLGHSPTPSPRGGSARLPPGKPRPSAGGAAGVSPPASKGRREGPGLWVREFSAHRPSRAVAARSRQLWPPRAVQAATSEGGLPAALTSWDRPCRRAEGHRHPQQNLHPLPPGGASRDQATRSPQPAGDPEPEAWWPLSALSRDTVSANAPRSPRCAPRSHTQARRTTGQHTRSCHHLRKQNDGRAAGDAMRGMTLLWPGRGLCCRLHDLSLSNPQ